MVLESIPDQSLTDYLNVLAVNQRTLGIVLDHQQGDIIKLAKSYVHMRFTLGLFVGSKKEEAKVPHKDAWLILTQHLYPLLSTKLHQSLVII